MPNCSSTEYLFVFFGHFSKSLYLVMQVSDSHDQKEHNGSADHFRHDSVLIARAPLRTRYAHGIPAPRACCTLNPLSLVMPWSDFHDGQPRLFFIRPSPRHASGFLSPSCPPHAPRDASRETKKFTPPSQIVHERSQDLPTEEHPTEAFHFVAQLSKPVNICPREKPIPKAKQLTKWEQVCLLSVFITVSRVCVCVCSFILFVSVCVCVCV
jgi:hypothetical protein